MVLDTLLSRYQEEQGIWRHQYKALVVHQYLIQNSTAQFVELSIKYIKYV
jgi:hypothetical protein